MSVKKIPAGKGNCTCVKEVLECTLDIEAGTVTPPERKIQELLTLVDIPVTQHRMGRKDLESLVENLQSMHLTVTGAVDHLFHIKHSLNQVGVDRSWLSPSFYCKIVDWRALALQAAARPTHVYDILHLEPTHLGFWDASGLGVGGGLAWPSSNG